LTLHHETTVSSTLSNGCRHGRDRRRAGCGGHPRAWCEFPTGALLCIGGVFGMLPVLGFWMLPAGLFLLAEDMPPLRRATSQILDWIERWRPHFFAATRLN